MIVLIHQAGPCSGNCCQSKSGKEKWPADKPVLPNHLSILNADSVYETANYASWKTPWLHFGQKLAPPLEDLVKAQVLICDGGLFRRQEQELDSIRK